jgi:hypothetical protein
MPFSTTLVASGAIALERRLLAGLGAEPEGTMRRWLSKIALNLHEEASCGETPGFAVPYQQFSFWLFARALEQ